MSYVGGCHCGAIRYRLEAEPVHVDLCHCVDCRRNSGAPVVCWAGFPDSALTFEKGPAENLQFVRIRDARFLRRLRHGPLLPERTALARYRRGPVSDAGRSGGTAAAPAYPGGRKAQLDGDGARTAVGRTLSGDGLGLIARRRCAPPRYQFNPRRAPPRRCSEEPSLPARGL